ncbi:MAG: DMT family transporter [Syntrophobacteraceae bacterium]
MRSGVFYAIAAAVLFGASTPFAKLLVGGIDPILLAGLLYLGSGCGLAIWLLYRSRFGDRRKDPSIKAAQLPWLAGAIIAGGIAGPVLLMSGLKTIPASSASLLLNMEGVCTAVLAWIVFRENFDRRIVFGMVAIAAGGAVLSFSGSKQFALHWGSLMIIGACLMWGIDNNLTRKISAGDPLQIAGAKGLVAGCTNIFIAYLSGADFPAPLASFAAMFLGILGYGLSLVCFVVSLRHLGTARTGAYFSIAPFVGAALSILILREGVTALFFIGAFLMGIGVWIHLTEYHAHEHSHEEVVHDHGHSRDEHHEHEHDEELALSGAAHAHPHVHCKLLHSHPHYPDIHHRHRH